MGCLFRIIFWIFGVGILWFIPWVFVLHLGLLVYFPYEPNGIDRFVRVTGPVLQLLSKNPDWAGKEDISPFCFSALVAAEDSRFYEHFGLDYDSIQNAFLHNQASKRQVGGSTITQQIVKNAFLSRDKTYIRKTREMIGALLLDLSMNKNNQLAWYLNIVEFGPKLYGIQAASQHYFHKQPKQLSLAQCVALMAILPDPNKTYLSVTKKKSFQRIQKRYRVILKNLGGLQFIPRHQIEKTKGFLF